MEHVSRTWWVIGLRGLLAILFAVLAWVWPGMTLIALVWLWGFYAVLDGVFALVAATHAAERERPWGMLLLVGLSGIAAGVIAFLWPAITALVLAYLIAAWALVSGVSTIAAAVRLRRVIEGEWLLALSGFLTVLLGVLVAVIPGAALLGWVWMIGAYALFFGLVNLALAFRLRTLQRGEPRRRAMA